MSLLRAVYSLIASWWWGLAIDHVDAHHPDLPLLCARRKRHNDRLWQFVTTGEIE